MLSRRENTIGVLYLLASAACWGFVASTVKRLTWEMDPHTISFLRVLLATLVFVPLVWRERRSFRGLKWFLPWILLGALGRAGNYIIYNVGMTLVPSNAATITLPVQTVTTVLLAWLIMGERLQGKWPGLLLSLSGLALLWWNGQGWEVLTEPRYALGNALMFISGIASAFHFMSQKVLTARMSVSEMLLPVFGWATALTFPFAWWSGGLGRSYSLTSWALALFLGIILTGGSFIFLGEGYKRCSATTGVIVTNSSIFITLLLSLWLLHESVSPMMILGALLVLAGTMAVVQSDRLRLALVREDVSMPSCEVERP